MTPLTAQQTDQQPRQSVPFVDEGDENTIVQLPPRQLSVKARSKQELYRLLVVEGKVLGFMFAAGQFYLPPYQDVRMEFIRQLLSGKKKCFQNTQVRTIKLPSLREFKFDDMYQDATRFEQAREYLPDDGLKKKFDKQFLVNVSLLPREPTGAEHDESWLFPQQHQGSLRRP